MTDTQHNVSLRSLSYIVHIGTSGLSESLISFYLRDVEIHGFFLLIPIARRLKAQLMLLHRTSWDTYIVKVLNSLDFIIISTLIFLFSFSLSSHSLLLFDIIVFD